LAVQLEIESDEELRALRGALLAARATELAEMRRRSSRHQFGYGSPSQRESMTAEAAQAERRWVLLDRLLTAIESATREEAQ
jgi:hypothetical protein